MKLLLQTVQEVDAGNQLGEEGEPQRATWGGKLEFILTCVGQSNPFVQFNDRIFQIITYQCYGKVL